jgi:uncharacterized membrane protein
MKVFGHPVHIMLIHFPSALFPMAAVCSLISHYTSNFSFVNTSYYALCGGVLMGWAAILFGTFDLISIFEQKPSAMKKALVHGAINSIVVLIFTLLAYWQYKQYPSLQPDSFFVLLIKAITNVFMIVGNYIGGSLILKDKIAVDND